MFISIFTFHAKMRNSDSPQGIYAPLSQAMTDSESEEEIHDLNKGYKGSNHISLQNSIRNAMNNMHYNNFTDFNCNSDDHHRADVDNFAMMRTNLKQESMSAVRKCCFILSILICIFTILLFLWVIPCNESNTCPSSIDRIPIHNWLNNYTRIELKGLVNVVEGLKSWERNLIFMYRGDKFFPEFEESKKKRNGIISIISNSGAIAWFDEMVNEPIAIDCTLIDADKDNRPDCLLIDEVGELSTINPVSGQWIWKFLDRGAHNINALDFPVVLPDLNGDGVYELILATNDGNISRNFIRILSGKTGQPLGRGYRASDCLYVYKFQLHQSFTVSFNCVNNDTEVQRSKSLLDLYVLTTNKSVVRKFSLPTIAQHKLYGQRKETEAQRSIYSIKGKELIIENRGKCPDNCNVSFTLTEEKNGETLVIRNFSDTMMYGMVPAQLSFRTKNDGIKMSGFVVKFWEWSKNYSDLQEKTRYKREKSNVSAEFNIFDQRINKKHGFTILNKYIRSERSVGNITKQKTDSIFINYKVRLIKETVVLIIFDSSDTHIENTSQSNIIQFCRTEKNEVVCQPDLNYQENSLLIADLDQDGSQELVSYYSTFVNKDENRKKWKLVTYVHLLRLESELPILFDQIKTN